MKKTTLLLLCATSVFANSTLLEKAQHYESLGDYKNAMIYYKKLATEKNTGAVLEQELNNKKLDKKEAIKIAEKINGAQDKIEVNIIDKEKKYKTASESQGTTIHQYKSNYLVYAHDFNEKDDRKNEELKFQISIQKPIFDDLLGLDETLTFAYTQKSFWQIWENSAPFRTTNYEPEIFVTFPTSFLNLDYLRFGLNHQSNGESGEKSRSWNRAYVSTSFNLGNLSVSPRIWKAFYLDDTNKDIDKYYGYGDILFKYDFGKTEISAILRNNLRFNSNNKGSLELNYFFPLFGGKYGGMIQYFTGYGESLADFNKHVDKISFGISFANH